MKCYLGINLPSCLCFCVRELPYYNKITEKKNVVLIMNNIAASGMFVHVPICELMPFQFKSWNSGFWMHNIFPAYFIALGISFIKPIQDLWLT